ncbi:unnamed protein product [Somion occarium]|uniref:Uncharacterized protein n=1 Tax=Somion occarium TaxID=3059160 RepID=A0ABP1DSE8_9APHY
MMRASLGPSVGRGAGLVLNFGRLDASPRSSPFMTSGCFQTMATVNCVARSLARAMMVAKGRSRDNESPFVLHFTEPIVRHVQCINIVKKQCRQTAPERNCCSRDTHTWCFLPGLTLRDVDMNTKIELAGPFSIDQLPPVVTCSGQLDCSLDFSSSMSPITASGSICTVDSAFVQKGLQPFFSSNAELTVPTWRSCLIIGTQGGSCILSWTASKCQYCLPLVPLPSPGFPNIQEFGKSLDLLINEQSSFHSKKPAEK